MLLRNNVIPKFATNGSACFDLHAHLSGVEIIKAYDTKNHSVILEVKRNRCNNSTLSSEQ